MFPGYTSTFVFLTIMTLVSVVPGEGAGKDMWHKKINKKINISQILNIDTTKAKNEKIPIFHLSS